MTPLPTHDTPPAFPTLPCRHAHGPRTAAPLLSGCAGPQVQDYAQEQPALDLKQYFNGPMQAHSIFTDRSGKVSEALRGRHAGQLEGQSRARWTNASPTATSTEQTASGT